MNRQMMNQLQQMQKKIVQAQEELGQTNVEGSAGGGMVMVTMNGHREVQAVKLDPEAVDPQDVELLQDMIMAAIKDASQKAQQLSEAKLGPLTGGMNIPGLF